jgi:hypothetical protein
MPHKFNLMTDKWTKTTGARAQHYSRNVPQDRASEAREPVEPGPSKLVFEKREAERFERVGTTYHGYDVVNPNPERRSK